mmetsp:Transcript_3557/g.22353  ORF Transcript_3557/g.22353 Transcript_3557/m.22353 type:complete len:283 (+) Transcript_3557:605-1453(+)
MMVWNKVKVSTKSAMGKMSHKLGKEDSDRLYAEDPVTYRHMTALKLLRQGLKHFCKMVEEYKDYMESISAAGRRLGEGYTEAADTELPAKATKVPELLEGHELLPELRAYLRDMGSAEAMAHAPVGEIAATITSNLETIRDDLEARYRTEVKPLKREYMHSKTAFNARNEEVQLGRAQVEKSGEPSEKLAELETQLNTLKATWKQVSPRLNHAASVLLNDFEPRVMDALHTIAVDQNRAFSELLANAPKIPAPASARGDKAGTAKQTGFTAVPLTKANPFEK